MRVIPNDKTENETDGPEISADGRTTLRENERTERKLQRVSRNKTERREEQSKQQAGTCESAMLAYHSNKLNRTN